MYSLQRLPAVFVCAMLATVSAHAVPSVKNLGYLPAGDGVVIAQALGISDNGQVVVGYSALFNGDPDSLPSVRQKAFRWTLAGGMQALRHLPGGSEVASANAISGDGRVVVGISDGRAADGTQFWSHATIWRGQDAPQDLGTLPGADQSSANGVDRVGERIAGYSKNSSGTLRAVLWRSGRPPQDLGTLGGTGAYASDISRNGVYVVGVTHDAAQRSRAFIWSEARGMKDLGTLPGLAAAQATAVSANGDAVVGYSADTLDNWLMADAEVVKGFIWHRATGRIQEVVNTLGGLETLPLGISENGRVVVGMAKDAHGEPHAFRWTPENGMTIESSLPLAQRMALAREITPDGHYSVGRLAHIDRAFLATW